MSKKKHEPFRAPPRKICPVCGKVSFSAPGIHPQCAMNRAIAADRAARLAVMAAEKSPQPKLPPKCPKCGRDRAPRRQRCACGWGFGVG